MLLQALQVRVTDMEVVFASRGQHCHAHIHNNWATQSVTTVAKGSHISIQARTLVMDQLLLGYSCWPLLSFDPPRVLLRSRSDMEKFAHSENGDHPAFQDDQSVQESEATAQVFSRCYAPCLP